MSEWETLAASEYCVSVRDGTHDSPKPVERDGCPLVTSKMLKNGVVDVADAYLISRDDFEKINQRSKVDRWDVLMSMIGTVGECVLVKDEPNYAIKNMALFKFGGDESKAKWFYYFLTSSIGQSQLRGNFRGSSQQFVSLGQLRALKVPNPPLPTQRRIAAILSDYDAAIANCRKQIALLEEAAQRLYREWFGDGKGEKWPIRSIGELCTDIGSGGTPKRNKSEYWDSGDIPWVKTAELQDCWLFDTDEKITKQGLSGSSARLFPAKTVMMAIYASPTLGRLGIMGKPMCCNQATLCLIADETRISWQWLYCKLYELRDHFNAIARGAGQQNISGIVVKSQRVALPPKDLIDQFTVVVGPIFEQQKNLSQQIRALVEARDRLLPKLMSGEVAV